MIVKSKGAWRLLLSFERGAQVGSVSLRWPRGLLRIQTGGGMKRPWGGVRVGSKTEVSVWTRAGVERVARDLDFRGNRRTREMGNALGQVPRRGGLTLARLGCRRSRVDR